MRIILIFTRMQTKVEKYSKPGMYMYVTTDYKELLGKRFVYNITEDVYHAKGKLARRARRKNK